MDVVSSCMDTLSILVRSKRKLSINDLRLPWKPVYRLLKKDLFLKRRQFEIRSAPPLFDVKLCIETPHPARQRTRWASSPRPQEDSFIQHVLMKCCKNLCLASLEVISMYALLLQMCLRTGLIRVIFSKSSRISTTSSHSSLLVTLSTTSPCSLGCGSQ